MRLRRWMRFFAGLVLVVGFVRGLEAQADYPFRDPKLGDDARIADLLSRLTLDEKVSLMSDHPKIPRLGLAFSGQVEGLHGLALGGPGGWGGRRKWRARRCFWLARRRVLLRVRIWLWMGR